VLQTEGGEHDVSSLLHGVVHVISNDPRGPWAPMGTHGPGQDVDVDLIVGQAMLLVEPPVIPGKLLTVASLHEGIPQQHGEAMMVQ
jgi:hypothetical protein